MKVRVSGFTATENVVVDYIGLVIKNHRAHKKHFKVNVQQGQTVSFLSVGPIRVNGKLVT